MPDSLSPETLKEIVRKYVTDALDWEEKYQSEKALDPYEHEKRLQELENTILHHKEIVGEGRHHQEYRRIAADRLKKADIKADPKSTEFNQLCRLMAQADVKSSEVALKWLRGDWSAQDKARVVHELGLNVPRTTPVLTPVLDVNQTAPASATDSPATDSPASAAKGPAPASAQSSALTLGQLVSAFWKERSPGWKPRTKTDYETCRSRLLEAIGDGLPVSSLDYYKVKRFRDDLHETGLSTSRVNLYIGFLKSILNFEMQTTRILPANPCEGLKLKDTRRKDELRGAFDLEDLKAMFVDSPGYGQDQFKQPERFWVPLLSLYSGARMEELCQLYADQVKEIDGYWCFEIEAKYPGQSVKTSEKRAVPLSPFLLELGFHRFAQTVGQGHLWPGLPRINNRYGHYFSRWFKEFKDRCGIDPTKNYKVFHSFRHTAETKLQYEEVEQRYIDQLLGHSDRSEASRYGKRFMERLYENAVIKLDWHEQLDLSHLLRSKWAVG